jgi:hypothetical protein
MPSKRPSERAIHLGARIATLNGAPGLTAPRSFTREAESCSDAEVLAAFIRNSCAVIEHLSRPYTQTGDDWPAGVMARIADLDHKAGALARRLAAIPATSPRDLRAKVRALMAMRPVLSSGELQASNNADEALAFSVARDLAELGLGAAGADSSHTPETANA